MRQRIKGQCLADTLFRFQGDLDAAVEAVFALPEGFKARALFLELADAEPEEGFAAEGDELGAMPMLYQQAAHQGVEGLFHPFRPGFVAERLVGHGVGPEELLAQAAGGFEIGRGLAIQVFVEDLAGDLAAAADEGLAVLHLVPSRITTEEAQGRIGIAQTDDGVQRVLGELFVDRKIDTWKIGSELAKGFALCGRQRHTTGLHRGINPSSRALRCG